MVIDEINCKSRINSLTYRDWQQLLTLIPEIEKTSNFCEWYGGDKDEEGIIHLPCSVSAPIVSQFLEIVYAIPIIINFDWGAWEEGRKIASNEDFDFDTIDLVMKCKLITAIVRNDRFCEGTLVFAFESGLILKILKSIEREIRNKGMAY